MKRNIYLSEFRKIYATCVLCLKGKLINELDNSSRLF